MTDTSRQVHIGSDTLHLYFAGVLPPLRETRVEEHLADCAWCTRRARTVFASLAGWPPAVGVVRGSGSGSNKD